MTQRDLGRQRRLAGISDVAAALQA